LPLRASGSFRGQPAEQEAPYCLFSNALCSASRALLTLGLAPDAQLADDRPFIEKAGRRPIELPNPYYVFRMFDRGQQVRPVPLSRTPGTARDAEERAQGGLRHGAHPGNRHLRSATFPGHEMHLVERMLVDPVEVPDAGPPQGLGVGEFGRRAGRAAGLPGAVASEKAPGGGVPILSGVDRLADRRLARVERSLLRCQRASRLLHAE
jgi:hypothetical protein